MSTLPGLHLRSNGKAEWWQLLQTNSVSPEALDVDSLALDKYRAGLCSKESQLLLVAIQTELSVFALTAVAMHFCTFMPSEPQDKFSGAGLLRQLKSKMALRASGSSC